MADERSRRDDRTPRDEGARRPARRRRGGHAVGAAIALFTVAAFGSGLWFAYDQGVRKGVKLSPPLIKAPEGPFKVAPASPGGLVVPDQDKLIYGRLSGGPPPPKVERLLPPPERPAPEPPTMRSAATADAPPPPSTAETAAGPPVPEEEAAAGIAPAAGRPGKAGDGSATADSAAKRGPAVAAARPSGAVPTTIGKTVDKGRTGAKPRSAPAPGAEQPTREEEAKEPSRSGTGAIPRLSATDEGDDKAYRVQLAAFRDLAAAEEGWRRLSKAHGDLLGGLAPVIVRADLGPKKGVFFRLQAGPLADRAAAAALCAKLKARKQGCLIVTPR